MGNFFSYYETSFELPDYGDSSFKRDIDIVLKYIKILENIDYIDEFYESQSSIGFAKASNGCEARV